MGTLETPIEILLVEDNPGDVELIQRALRNSDYHHNLTVAVDGEEAMATLRGRGQRSDTPLPDFILLDLNLPKKDGREVLAEVKADPKLQSIPVIVLTTSKAEQDLLDSYEAHANSYVVKPADARQSEMVMSKILDYWLNISMLPRNIG
jgi:CheY-like chemotaxis protein